MKVNKKSNEFTSFNIGQTKEAEEINNAIEEVTSTKYEVKNIPIEDIEFNPNNTRFNDEDTDEEIEELAENIKLYGLFHPIGVFPRGDKYMLFSGERRTKAFQKLKKRYIPAMIFPDMGDFGNMERLYQANLQSRMLDVRKRFLAFKDLLSGYETKISAGQTDELANKLRITRATVKKYKELYQNAAEGDFELLESGEITWDEFVRHTSDIIAENEKLQYKRRIEVISKKSESIKATNYKDQGNNAIYSVECDENGQFCTAVTDANLFKVPLHFQNQVFKTFDEAQVALNLFAISNNLAVYTGDFSEFKEQKNSSVTPAVQEKPVNTDQEEAEMANEEDFAPSLFETVPDQTVGSKGISSSEKVSDNFDVDEGDEEIEEDNIIVDAEEPKTAVKDTDKADSSEEKETTADDSEKSAENEPKNQDSDYLKQYATFSGYSIKDHKRYEGALAYTETRAFIIIKLGIDAGVAVSKAARKTNSYYVEVEPKSVIRHDLK